MVQAKRIYNLMIKVNKLIFFFASHYFLKVVENMFSMFLSSYRLKHLFGRTWKSCGNTRLQLVLPQHIVTFSQTSACVSVSVKTVHVFYFLNKLVLYRDGFNKSHFPMLSFMGSICSITSLASSYELMSFTNIKEFYEKTFQWSAPVNLNWCHSCLVLQQLLVTLVEYPTTFFIQFLRSTIFCITTCI